MNDHRLRILYVLPVPAVPAMAAPTFQVFKMCQAFAKLGHSVTVLNFVGFAEWKIPIDRLLEHYGVAESFRIVRLPVRRIHRLLEALGIGNHFIGLILLAVAAARRANLIYTRHSAAAFWAVRCGFDTIYETHPFPFGEQQEWDHKHHEPQLLSLATKGNFRGLVTLSPLVGDAYLEIGMPKEKIIVQPSAIDLERFDTHWTKGEARSRLGIQPNSSIALYSGRFSRLKGTELIYQMAASLPDVKFLLVGYWGDHQLKKEMWERFPELSNLEIKGPISSTELPLWLAAADVLLMPTLSTDLSSQWTSPLKLLEYMASGRPIVASDLPNVRPLLENSPLSVLVNNDSVDSYVTGIGKIIDRLNEPEHEQNEHPLQILAQHTYTERCRAILQYVGIQAT